MVVFVCKGNWEIEEVRLFLRRRHFLCCTLVNYYNKDSNSFFVLVLIAAHSWCVLPSGRPLIKPFPPQEVGLSITSSPLRRRLRTPTTSPIPPSSKPFHFARAASGIIYAFSSHRWLDGIMLQRILERLQAAAVCQSLGTTGREKAVCARPLGRR